MQLGPISGATNLTHTFAQAGSFTVTATIVDSTGQGATASVSVLVGRSAPTVSITASPPTAITVGSVVAFTITAAPMTSGPPLQSVTATINGVTVFSGVGGGTFTFTRQFNNPGTQTVIATATDITGGQASASTVVLVNARAVIEMTLDAAAATGAALTCNPANAYPKTCTAANFQQITFNAGFVGTAPPSDITGYNWIVDGAPVFTTNNRNMSANFATSGTHTVQVSVNTASGGTGSQVITIIVP